MSTVVLILLLHAQQDALTQYKEYFHIIIQLLSSIQTNKNKLHGLSPRANYTDRATAFLSEVIANFCG
jgi:hypothetical protein